MGIISDVVNGVPVDCEPDARLSPVVQGFLSRRVVNEPVTVLVEFHDENALVDGRWIVVDFKDWDVVRALYSLVEKLQLSGEIRRAGAFRSLGTSAEVDTPLVRARESASAPECGIAGRPLGDGVLLSEQEAAGLWRGEELKRLILVVQDDGILLVKHEDGQATIDLTTLAKIGRQQ